MSAAAPPALAPAAEVRALVRRAGAAALSTLLDGAPYGSLVALASDGQGRPLLLLSDLAVHSRNLAVDPRASLLVEDTGGRSDPLEGPRATLLGRLAPVAAPDLLARFVARHPSAAGYAGFADFRLYRLEPERAHLVAGFGRIHWVEDAAALLLQATPALAAAEAEILAHMNADHGAALALIARHLLALPGEGWRLVGLDAEGMDLRRDGVLARLAFAKNVTDAESCRVELVRLTRKARQAAGRQEGGDAFAPP